MRALLRPCRFDLSNTCEHEDYKGNRGRGEAGVCQGYVTMIVHAGEGRTMLQPVLAAVIVTVIFVVICLNIPAS